MRLLLDTHTLIWALDDTAQLSAPATAALQDPPNTTIAECRHDLGNLD